jgi:aminopeptidase N
MENITATTLSDIEILSAVQGERNVEIENLVSHELAHSWFGNLVTCKNWANLWLNEGLATFMESAFLEREYGREAYLREMRKNAEFFFAQEDVGLRHPLLNFRAKPDAFLFDTTTYKKGGFVIHMLREAVGEEMFWKSLNNYLTTHKFQNVETDDLQKAFEQTTSQNLDWFFDQWIRKAGYPRLQIEPAYNPVGKQLVLKIRQTQKTDSQIPEVFRFTTEIEITTPEGSKVEKIVMNQREQSFSFPVAAKPTKIDFDIGERILKKFEINSLTTF